MKLTSAVRLLELLNSRPEDALTTMQITRKWRDLGGTEVGERTVQRYMKELSEDSAEGPALVEMLVKDGERKFYLRVSQIANWFMTLEAALNLQFSRQVLGRAFGSMGRSNGDKLTDMADRVANASTETKRIRDRLRIVPDGIGRLPARIDQRVLAASIEAIKSGKKLRLTYVDSSGKESAPLVSPLGLVAKDGTIYLVAIKGLSDAPRHFPLHRMTEANASAQLAQTRLDFDLDRYIHDSHQFSHVLDADAPLEVLKLRVAPETIYHFRERALSTDQSIGPARRSDGWRVVTATVPVTVLLVPFLLSMGPWIRVLEPPSVRDETAKRLHAAAAHYSAAIAG
jgi:predicted DNA-binding transcriptional regulator YafY